ncbi:MAG: N-acetylgalactosamine-6-sulfatase, partial [Planctomycetota bacterium]
TSCRDWAPTLASVCGLQSPGLDFDGVDISPLLRGSSSAWKDRTLFVQRQGNQPELILRPKAGSRYPHYCAMTQRWRLVDGQLFDIDKDPGQQHNVASQYPGVVRELSQQYAAHFRDVFPADKSDSRFQVGDDSENPTQMTVRDWHPTQGRVIWKPEQLNDDRLAINGRWLLHVCHPGRYELRLRRFPQDASAAMRCSHAEVLLGDQRMQGSIDESAEVAIFQLVIPAGDTTLQTWLTNADTGVRRGAYFVEIERLPDNNVLDVPQPAPVN